MESETNVPPYRHTPKGMSLTDKTTKSTKCCDTCGCETTKEEKFNKLMESQTSFEE